MIALAYGRASGLFYRCQVRINCVVTMGAVLLTNRNFFWQNHHA
jgi:hypothetical protein